MEAGETLWFFLFEEAAEGVDGIGRVPGRVRLLKWIGTGRGAAHATELRFQQAGSDSADVRDKFRLSSCALNQKRNSGAFAVALAAADRAKNPSDT